MMPLPGNIKMAGGGNLKDGLGGIHWGILPAFLSLTLLTTGQGALFRPAILIVVLAGLMASYDLAVRRIPNPLTAICAIAGLLLALTQGGGWGLWDAFLGGLVGFSLMAVFFFMGAVGGGDVKALGALGVFLGPMGAFHLFILTTLAGGGLALVRIAQRKWGHHLGNGVQPAATKKESLPYGLAIWGGSIIYSIMEMLK